MNGTILESNATCVVRIDPEPLKISIDGGSLRQVPASEDIHLNASLNQLSPSASGELNQDSQVNEINGDLFRQLSVSTIDYNHSYTYKT